MARKINMISQGSFFGRIFRSVRGVFVFFNAGMYKKAYEELGDLKHFVELNYNEVCDWGYPCSYVPYRLALIPASNKDVLKEILEIFQPLSQDQNRDDVKIIVSEHLWRLMEGWQADCVLELFWSRIGLEPTVGYKRADIDGRVKKEKSFQIRVKKEKSFQIF